MERIADPHEDAYRASLNKGNWLHGKYITKKHGQVSKHDYATEKA